jgi:long-chain acyl-CoA synthetase
MLCRSTGTSRPREANYILRDSGASVLVAHTDLLAQIAGGVPEGVKVFAVPTPDEIATGYGVPVERRRVPAGAESWEEFVAASAPRTEPPRAARGSMIYTSGTTGRPKGVRRQPSTPEQQVAGAQEAALFWGAEARSVDRRADERPDVPLRPGRVRHGERAAWPAHGAAAALRG